MSLAKSAKPRNAVRTCFARPIAKVGVVGASAGTAANDASLRAMPAAAPATIRETIDPVLLIHEQRAETFRLLAQWIRNAVMGRAPEGTPA
jgi:hypothetical protein